MHINWQNDIFYVSIQTGSQVTVDPLGISSPVPQSPSDIRMSRLSVDIPPPAIGEKRRSSQDTGAVASPTKKLPQLSNITYVKVTALNSVYILPFK